MKNNQNKASAKKIFNIILVVLLVISILSTAFGSCIAIMYKPSASKGNSSTDKTDGKENFVSPLEQYDRDGKENTATLNEDVVTLSKEQAQAINSSITDITESYDYNNELFYKVALNPTADSALTDVNSGEYIFLPATENSKLGGDRIFLVKNKYSDGGNTILELDEPYFEDVFSELEIYASEYLTEENLKNAYFADGVSAHFGDTEVEIENVNKEYALDAEVVNLSNSSAPKVEPCADKASTDPKDLIVNINYTMKEEKIKGTSLDKSLAIKGEFGVKNLAAHMVCDIEDGLDINELYFGLSGDIVAGIDVSGGVSGDFSKDPEEEDYFFFTLEGLSEKRFPIAIFEFQGLTPITLSKAAFEVSKEKITPSLYLMVYLDWSGNIDLSLSAGFDYTKSFNNGLSVVKNGEVSLLFEAYPYVDSFPNADNNGLDWHVNFELEAQTDAHLGCSALFYLLGVNMCEVSAIRVGAEAKCDINAEASIKEGFKLLEEEDTEFYIRGYTKIIGVYVKLKAEGNGILKKLGSLEAEFDFTLLDLTLFEKGVVPPEFKKVKPVSTMEYPKKFDSAMILVCDTSGSMASALESGESKIEAAKEAGKIVIETTAQQSNNYGGTLGIGLVRFESSAENVAFPHIDYEFLKDCVALYESGGGTNIASGLEAAIGQLESIKSENKVIVLMTDGQDSSNAVSKAEDAAEKGITVHTIGFGSDVQEQVLIDIADAANGEYQYANTNSIVSIVGSFIHNQKSIDSTVLAETEGAVAEGETSKKTTFTIEKGMRYGSLDVTTYYPGSFLKTIIEDPNGVKVDENYPGAKIDETKIPSNLVIENPIAGEWSVRIKGVETSYAKEPFYTAISYKTNDDIVSATPKLDTLQTIAAYCIPIGIFTIILSTVLLIAFNKKKKEQS